jgi:hypothetical protein
VATLLAIRPRFKETRRFRVRRLLLGVRVCVKAWTRLCSLLLLLNDLNLFRLFIWHFPFSHGAHGLLFCKLGIVVSGSHAISRHAFVSFDCILLLNEFAAIIFFVPKNVIMRRNTRRFRFYKLFAKRRCVRHTPGTLGLLTFSPGLLDFVLAGSWLHCHYAGASIRDIGFIYGLLKSLLS